MGGGGVCVFGWMGMTETERRTNKKKETGGLSYRQD